MMEKSQAIIIFASVLCLLSLVDVSTADTDQFSVEGMVYCDTCRLQFMTRVSYFMEGATVRLQCRNITTGIENFNEQAVTDKSGHYSFKVSGDFEDDICQVTLVKSSKDDCNEIPIEALGQAGAQISLTSNNGEATSLRNANPLGFVKKEPLAECEAVIKELEMDDTDDVGHGEAQFTIEPIAPEAAVEPGAPAAKEAGAGKEVNSASGAGAGAEAGAAGEANSASGAGAGAEAGEAEAGAGGEVGSKSEAGAN